MFYRGTSETIFKSSDTTGSFIHRRKKIDELGILNFRLQESIKQLGIKLNYKKGDMSFTQEVFNRVPLYLNFLSLRGYKKILFVGFYEAFYSDWFHLTKSDKILHNTPAERWYQDHFPDMDVLTQFLPIVKMAYGYDNFDMHVVEPPTFRNKQLMHALYDKYGVDKVPANVQYRYGRSDMDITPPSDTKYDAVVLCGIPKMNEDTTSTLMDVHSTFGKYMEDNYDIIDLSYEDKDPNKFTDANNKLIESEMVQVWTNRSLWDLNFKNYHQETRTTEFNILKMMFKIYPIRR